MHSVKQMFGRITAVMGTAKPLSVDVAEEFLGQLVEEARSVMLKLLQDKDCSVRELR